MSISSVTGRIRGRSNAAVAYRHSFLAHCGRLVEIAFSRLDKAPLAAKEEPAITGLLVEEMRRVAEDPANRWASRYSIHDDPPLSSPGREGKSRPRVDIQVERAQLGERPRFQFEAKRLNHSGSVGEYLGADGLGCFMSGRYAAGHADAGMLGYVQSASAKTWAARIAQRLAAAPQDFGLAARRPCWAQVPSSIAGVARYRSEHRRVSNGPPISIHHMLLACQAS